MKPKFGQNFKENLLQTFSQERLEESKRFMREFLEINQFEDATFLDAGCGSGVFTVAARALGADVTSFDIDEVALTNTRNLLYEFGYHFDERRLLLGSILDASFVSSLGKFDFVMCWGVAHHTGEMWKSLDLICQTVKPGGVIHLGVYNKADGWGFYPDGRFGPSTFWEKIKKVYSRLSPFLQNVVDKMAVIGIFSLHLITFNNPIKKLKENERRGMNWQSDLKDWLIGYPYEYATPEEVFEFMKERGFSLTKLRTNNGLLTNNYVFRKKI